MDGTITAPVLDFPRIKREMGIGDLSIGKQVKRMARAFFGRIRAYEEGLAGDDPALGAVLARNLFGTVSQSAPFAGMAGVWSGGGTITLDSGASERIRCRATYAVSSGGDGLKYIITRPGHSPADTVNANLGEDVSINIPFAPEGAVITEATHPNWVCKITVQP